MNFSKLHPHDSGASSGCVFVLRNAFGAALLGCLMSCTAPMKTTPNFAHFPALPYQNVRDLGKKLPPLAVGGKSSTQIDDLALFLFPDNSPQEGDEFVDDFGNVFTREELEARNK